MMMSVSIGDGSSYFSSRPALLAVDDERVLLAELALHPLGGLVVLRLQLLVVGRHGRVGDPELLCHGRVAPF